MRLPPPCLTVGVLVVVFFSQKVKFLNLISSLNVVPVVSMQGVKLQTASNVNINLGFESKKWYLPTSTTLVWCLSYCGLIDTHGSKC